MDDVVPDGWTKIKFQDVCYFQEGPGLRRWQYRAEGFPFLNIRCIENGYLNLDKVQFISQEEAEGTYSHFWLDEGDLVLSSSGTLGRMALIRSQDLPLMLNTSVIRFRSNDESSLISSFLPHYLQGQEFVDQITEESQGSAQANFGPTHLKMVTSTLPPLPEQKKIATILTSVDTVIEKTQAQIDKLNDLKTGMMQELLTKGIGPDGKPHTEFKDSPVGRIPVGWDVRPLNTFCELQVGYAFKSKEFQEDGVRLLRGENVGYGKPNWKNQQCIANELSERYNEYQLSQSDIVIGMDRTFTKSGMKLTRLSDIDLPCLLVQRVGKFIAKRCDKNFLWHLLGSQIYIDGLQKLEQGMDIPHLSKSEILSPELPLPSEDEQIRIGKVMSVVETRIVSKTKQLMGFELIKRALMQDLLTGKVRTTPDAA